MPFSDGLPFPIFGNMAEIPRRVVAVPDTDIRATFEDIWVEAGSKYGDAVFRGQPELFEQGQAPDDHEIGLSGRRAWQGTPRVRTRFLPAWRGGAVAVRFRFHVLDEHAVSHGIPYRVGPAVSVPGEHGGNMAEIPRVVAVQIRTSGRL